MLTRGAAAAEQVLSWEPDAGSPRVLAHGADVLTAAGGTAVLELPSGEIQLLDPYGNRPRRILVELPGPVSGPVSGQVAISGTAAVSPSRHLGATPARGARPTTSRLVRRARTSAG